MSVKMRVLAVVIIALLIGVGMGAIFIGPLTTPSKTIHLTSYETETLYSTILVTDYLKETSTTTIFTTKMMTEINYLTYTSTKTEISTTTIYKTYCEAPMFSTTSSDDPYKDFYVTYCGEIIFSKARTQIWDYTFIPGDEMNYVHLLVGYLENGKWDFAEGMGDKIETALINHRGRYLEWVSHLYEDEHNFESEARVRVFIVNGYIIIGVEASITPYEDFDNVVDLYVEFGRKSGGFKSTAIKVGEQILTREMVYTGEERYVSHYFEDQKISRNGWIAGETLDGGATLALVFRSAEIITPEGYIIKIDEITPSALDTAGHYDTIELHLIEAEWNRPETLKTGYTYRLTYYILMSRESGFQWIDSLISFL